MDRCLFTKCNKKIPANKRNDAIYCSDFCRKKDHYNRFKNETDTSSERKRNSDKIILSLCDYTGAWSDPYRENGYSVTQIDIQHGEDVRLFPYVENVYGVLAAPPCTHFSSSGADSWERKGDIALLEGLSVVDAFFRIVHASKIMPKFWALENPIGRLKNWIGPPNHYFNPCDFGDAYTKRTCLWGNFNAPQPKNRVEPIKAPNGQHSLDAWLRQHGKKMGYKNRGDKRSVTPPGFAQAFFEANP